jgi:hypothetical protein
VNFPAASSNEPPTVRVRTPAGTARVLRAHFFRHNWRVALIAVGTLVAAAAAWVLLYLAGYSLLLVALTTFDPEREAPPHGFGVLFAVAAVCALGYAWLDHRLTPSARPSDSKGIWDLVSEIVLVVPNMTLSVGGTLQAWQHLCETELREAAALLHRLAEERRVPMSGVRLQIPDPASAMRVLFALQLTDVIDVQREDNEFWLRLNALRPAALRLGRGEVQEA